MQFLFYIVNTSSGVVYGTDDKDEAYELSNHDDLYVIDSLTGVYIVYEESIKIKEA